MGNQSQIVPVVTGLVASELTAHNVDLSRVNLVTPATSLAAVPPCSALAISSAVFGPEHVYNVQGEVALNKYALDTLCALAKISWSPTERVDDRSDTCVCEVRVSGTMTNLDGTVRCLTGSKQIDLRGLRNDEDTWGITTAAWMAKATAKKKDGWHQVVTAREFILETTESKAKNRAIRCLGVPSSMTQERAFRPWVVVSLQQQLPDTPETRRLAAESAYGLDRMLYPDTGQQIIDITPRPDPVPMLVGGEGSDDPFSGSRGPLPLPRTDKEISAIPKDQPELYEAWQLCNHWVMKFLKKYGDTCADAITRVCPEDLAALNSEEVLSLQNAITGACGGMVMRPNREGVLKWYSQ